MPSPRAQDFHGRLIETDGLTFRSGRAIGRALNPNGPHTGLQWCNAARCDPCHRRARMVIDGHNERVSRTLPPVITADSSPAERALCQPMSRQPYAVGGPGNLNCELCGSSFKAKWMTWVMGAVRPIYGQVACVGCTRENAVYSRAESRWVIRRMTSTIVDSATPNELVSSEYAGECGAIRCSGCRRFYLNLAHHRLEEGCGNMEEDGRVTYAYHGTTPMATHGWPTVTPKDGLCFGVELEMEHRHYDSNTGQAKLAKLLGGKDGFLQDPEIGGRYVLERDGSLNNSGVELITNPYTLDFHLNGFNWKKVLSAVRPKAMSGKGTQRCGMHVHCNRKAISSLNLGKLMVFINAAGNNDLVLQVAQRKTSFAKIMRKKISDGQQRESEKYEAIHVGPNTVEFRIFRGNLKPERILKNIEFCHAAIMYCRDASLNALESPTGFKVWLSKNRGTYRNLANFLGADIEMTDDTKEE